MADPQAAPLIVPTGPGSGGRHASSEGALLHVRGHLRAQGHNRSRRGFANTKDRAPASAAIGKEAVMVKARTFLYVCAGLLCLALAFHLGARAEGAQIGGPQDVALLSGVVPDGGTIPLPHFQDGSEAVESECRWTVSPQIIADPYAQPVFTRCSTEGRTVRVYWCRGGCGPGGDCTSDVPGCARLTPGTANFLIVAVRTIGATPAQRESWGAMKSRYRGERGAGQPAPQDR